ncbi:MAG: ribulose-phosphate 3-epimerase [Carnobacterium inhibens]|uniref:ribulose-phosphate 3-epimerase n=1 Tax=Carnobacterium inhibens TaxID=147709 RepID=UPI00331538D0
MTVIATSILSADYMKLGAELESIEEAGVDYLHLDVMDGHFVPNITFGPEMVAQMNKQTQLPLDVHLMIENPEKTIFQYAKSGASIISVHYEACEDVEKVINLIKKNGCKAGIVINPDTPAEKIKEFLADVSLVLQMTVTPGFGGQKFIDTTLKNIKKLTQWREEKGYDFLIEVDGGINKKTAAICIENGVDVLVVGSYFIDAPNRRKLVKELHSL